MLAVESWAGFFERRIDARPLALCRIGVGACAFLRGMTSYHLLDRLLVDGVVRARAFEWLPSLDRTTMAVYIAVWLVASTGFALGWRTRSSGSVLLACIVYHLAMDQTLFWSHVYFLGWIVLWMVLADSGADLSRDWLRRGRPAAGIPAWPLILVKTQLSALYFYTAVAKLNPYFLSGEVLRDSFWLPEAWKPAQLMQAVAWATVVLEFALAFGLWMPRLRWVVLPGGVLFHLLVPVMIGLYGGLVVFSGTVLSLYPLFFSDKLVEPLRDPDGLLEGLLARVLGRPPDGYSPSTNSVA